MHQSPGMQGALGKAKSTLICDCHQETALGFMKSGQWVAPGHSCTKAYMVGAQIGVAILILAS